jgi:hypothetical protein
VLVAVSEKLPRGYRVRPATRALPDGRWGAFSEGGRRGLTETTKITLQPLAAFKETLQACYYALQRST